ncbi:DNA mismatch repair protein MutL [Multifurca ochricompacta]|uniref:DNA mismatch repair protein MutL n=1 Tax=Multifurca ochricompacta TaxID=376703 RepID=A0AAD4QN01_9AGAM|nr:DNA mismatch repair protein MutL [Multifurca ochricompacta]
MSIMDPIESQPEPKPIIRLQDSVINRIAAGEIIHRPASALKELLENCLDAGATSIRITVKDGGMKLLQIQDNGCGIKKSDLPILAHRFTTSKLSKFSDLSHLTTYGFRGEALASISHVANLSVVTKTKTDSCAWRAIYVDGGMVPAQKDASADPKPCAGNDGTTVTVRRELFYNVPARLSALRSSSEEYARILDVVTKYAVHNAGVSFLCKKVGISTPDLSTPSSTTKQAIRLLYGQEVAKNLLSAEISAPQMRKRKRNADDNIPEGSKSDEDNIWMAQAHFTNANHHSKKSVLLLFINNRLVESSRIKKALEACYTAILPKGTSPFIYLSIQLDPTTVDVNVHPTKREVHFLKEEAITECIADAIQAKLAQSGERTFEYQTLLTGGLATVGVDKSFKGKEKAQENSAGSDTATSTPLSGLPATKKILSQHKVRTSGADRTLDSMFLPTPTQSGDRDVEIARNGADVVKEGRKTRVIPQSTCYLTSVLTLRENVKKAKHMQLTEVLQKHVFVGVVDLVRELSVVQVSTKLYLVNHGALAEELFYQLGLRQFGNFPRLKLDPPAPLRPLITLAVDVEQSTDLSKLTKPQIVDSDIFATRRAVNTHILISRRDMLREYFSLGITVEGMVDSLPVLIHDFTPNLDKLPLFLMRLGPQVNWNCEQECFDTFLRELAYFYVPGPGALAAPSSPPVGHSEGNATGRDDDHALNVQREGASERWQIEHVLFPAMRRYLTAPKSLLTRDVVQIASLPDLYRVFERC